MIEVEITPARSLDAGVVGHILTVSNDQTPWLPRVHTAAEEIKYSGEMIDAGWVRLAKAMGKVLGFIAREETEIHALYIVAEAQGKGVGTVLLENAKAECAKLGLWSYDANQAAGHFYRQRGFNEKNRTDGSGNDARLPDIRFEWTLKRS